MNNSISRPKSPANRQHRSALLAVVWCALALLALGSGGQAQTVPFQSTQNPNVEVRHVPNAQVWPGWAKTTRAVNNGNKIPPTITHGPNGVQATLNPSWFSKAKVTRLPSGQLKLSCDDGSPIASSKTTSSKTRHLANKPVHRSVQKATVRR